ncbi:guanylate kinase [Candidatus Peregrinibacteria bacterium]|nr:MAG: guanylate kinase [Candidatus Peregrinibacteria bacterium]
MSSFFRGVLILIIGPSGVGKGTAINFLREEHPEWKYPVSATTRSIRKGETAGKTYYFLTPQEFEEKKQEGAFLEWALVHSKDQYGVLKSEVLPSLKEGKVVLREVDVQGFLEIQKFIPPEHLLSVFLLPPTKKQLIERIQARAPISEEELKHRLESMEKEMKIAPECNFQIQTQDGNPRFVTQKIEEIIKNWFEKQKMS